MDGKRKINIPNIPQVRYWLEFMVIKNYVLDDPDSMFLKALICSEGEVLADLFNSGYADIAKDKNIELETKNIFEKDDFEVVTGRIDETRGMTIVSLPDDPECKSIISYQHIFVYNIEDFDNVRFFTIERNGDAAIMMLELLRQQQKNQEHVNFVKDYPLAYLCELLKEGRRNYGIAPNNTEELIGRIMQIVDGENPYPFIENNLK